MSIFRSLAAPGDEHEDDCGIWVKNGGVWSMRSAGFCSCGQPDAPLVYRGSHVLPNPTDRRGGWVDMASIPGFIRVYRDDPDADPKGEDNMPPEPFLRFGVNGETVILTRRNVEQIQATLTDWLGRTADFEDADEEGIR